MTTKQMFLACSGLLLAACGNQQTTELNSSDSPPLAERKTASYTHADTSTKMIKSADITCEVPDVLNKAMRLERMAKEMGGYVQSSIINNDAGYTDKKIEIGDSVKILREHHLSADLVLQVPSIMLDSVMNSIPENAATVSKRQLSQQDASIDYMANEWRMQHNTAQNQSSAAQMAPPATEQLIAAHVQNLSIMKRVAYSCVSIHLTQPPVISSAMQLNIQRISQPSFAASLAAGLHSGTQALQSLIIAMAYIWPLLLACTAALSIVYFIKRKIATSAK